MDITIEIKSQQKKVAALQAQLIEEQAKLDNLEKCFNLCLIVEDADKTIAAAKKRREEAIASMPEEVAKFYLSLSASETNPADKEVNSADNDTGPTDNGVWTPVKADYIADTRHWSLAETIGGYEIYLRNKGNEVSAIALISDNAQSWTINEYHAVAKFAVSSAKDFLVDLGVDTRQSVLQEQEEVEILSSDWCETDLDVESEDDNWLNYDIPEYNNGYAVYFQYDTETPGGYSAIALIAEETTDPRSWIIEARFESKEGAYLEAQNFLSRIEGGEFEDSNSSEWEGEEFDKEFTSEEKEHLQDVLDKILNHKNLNRVSARDIERTGLMVGIAVVGKKTIMAKEIRNYVEAKKA